MRYIFNNTGHWRRFDREATESDAAVGRAAPLCIGRTIHRAVVVGIGAACQDHNRKDGKKRLHSDLLMKSLPLYTNALAGSRMPP